MLRLCCEQIDFVTAYLNARLRTTTVYANQPTGFSENDSLVCQLLQAVYGLRQSGFLWYIKLSQLLLSLGFKPLPDDLSVFIHRPNHEHPHLILIYVDDDLIIAPTHTAIRHIKERLSAAFQLKDLGAPSKFLGCHLTITDGFINMSQQAYVDKILMSRECSTAGPYPFQCIPRTALLLMSPLYFKMIVKQTILTHWAN